MNKMKRFGAAALALVLMLSFCACGGSSAADVMEQSGVAVGQLSSMHYDMEMDMILTVQGEAQRVLTDCKADFIAEPIAQCVETSVSMGAMGTMTSTTYTVPDGDGYMSYVTVDGGANWYKNAVADVQELKDYNMQSALVQYFASFEDMEAGEAEEISGVKATCYTGAVAEDALETVLDLSGVLNQLQSMGMVSDLVDISAMDLEPVTVAVWVDKDSMLPVRLEMDMTATVQGILAEVMGEEYSGLMTVERMTLLVELNAFDGVESITLPAGTENAQEMANTAA